MFNILCTGNPQKSMFAQALQYEFPNTVFACKTTGWDLTDYSIFKKNISDYNVFVNFSSFNSNVQLDLLNITAEEWSKKNIKGHIFNIGSISEYDFFKTKFPAYHEQKTNLKNRSLELCSETIKTTHLIVGGIRNKEDDHVEKLNCAEILYFIKIILNFQHNIPLISIESILDKYSDERKCIK